MASQNPCFDVAVSNAQAVALSENPRALDLDALLNLETLLIPSVGMMPKTLGMLVSFPWKLTRSRHPTMLRSQRHLVKGCRVMWRLSWWTLLDNWELSCRQLQRNMQVQWRSRQLLLRNLWPQMWRAHQYRQELLCLQCLLFSRRDWTRSRRLLRRSRRVCLLTRKI